MKTNLFIISALTSTLVILTGCQSGPQQTSAQPSASPEVKTTASASTPAPPVSAAPAVANTLSAPIRINAGAGAVKDATGIEWLGDTGFAGGDVVERPDQQIANTTQPEIYRSEHYSMDSFTQKLPNGKYQVKLHFCETYDGITGPGERVFTFDVAGKLFKDFDVWAKRAGSPRLMWRPCRWKSRMASSTLNSPLKLKIPRSTPSKSSPSNNQRNDFAPD